MAKRKTKEEKKVAYHCISNNLIYCLLLAEFDEIVIHPILRLFIKVIKTCLPFKAKINAFYGLCFTNSRAYKIHTSISNWQEETPHTCLVNKRKGDVRIRYHNYAKTMAITQ